MGTRLINVAIDSAQTHRRVPGRGGFWAALLAGKRLPTWLKGLAHGYPSRTFRNWP